MNREEVMALTDEGLRLTAAELMGWEQHVFGNWPLQMQPPDKPEIDGIPQVMDCPDYPNDIAAAWELLDAVPVEMHINVSRSPANDGWDIQIFTLTGHEFIVATDDLSVARAITCAFILAMENIG